MISIYHLLLTLAVRTVLDLHKMLGKSSKNLLPNGGGGKW